MKNRFLWLWQEIELRFGKEAALKLRQDYEASTQKGQRRQRAQCRKDKNALLSKGLKVCIGCGKVLSLDNFRRGGTSKSGRKARCRVCMSMKGRAPRKRRVQQKTQPRQYDDITAQDVENMSLEEWAKLPRSVQDRIIAEAERDM